MKTNEDRKRRRGPIKLPDADRRVHTVSVRLNDAELSRLEKSRGKYQRGEWLRMAAIDRMPPTIPTINHEAWVELSRAASNINQLSKYVHQNDPAGNEFMDKLRTQLIEFRNQLIGMQFVYDEDAE